MLLVAFFLAAILGVQAVDVVMYVPDGGLDGLGRPRVGSYPTDIHPVLRAAFRQAALWKPPQIWCHDLPPGKCCNNVFGYGGVNFTGLRPGYVVSTWKRFGSIERWLEMQAWRAPILGDATTEHASNVRPYGCGGGVLDVGHGDDSGLWTRPNPVYATKATGSMWWNCGEDPASSLRALFMPKITGSRSVLRSLIHIALYSCANLGSSIMPSIFPRSLETGPPSASVVEASMADSIADKAPTDDSTDTGTGASTDSGDNNYTDQAACVYPDLIIFNGTNYTESKPGELLYVDDDGSSLDLELLALVANETIPGYNTTTAP